MKLSERDKLLALILPAMIIVVAYGLFFARGKIIESTNASKTLEETRAKAPRPEQIAARQMQLAKAVQDTRAAQVKLEMLQNKWRYATVFCAAGPGRNDRVEKLTSLLNKHGLRPMEDSQVEAGGKDAKLSASVESMAKTFIKLVAAQQPVATGNSFASAQPQLRRIRFNGRFTDVLQALQELTHEEGLAIPVGLTMKTTADPQRREWVLLVWI